MEDGTTTLAAEMAAGLRRLADLIEANPELAEHCRYAFSDTNLSAPWVDHSDGDPREFLAAFARAGARAGLKVTKSASSSFQFVHLAINRYVSFKAFAAREQVCERVVTGTREVTETVPDPEYVAAAPLVERTRVEEIVEWRCQPLTAPAGAAVTA